MKILKTNLIYQIIYQIVIIIVPIITMPYISHIIGPKLLGENAYVVTIANYFVLFSMLGINNYASRLVSFNKSNQQNLNKCFSELLYLHIILSFITIFVYALIFIFINNEYKYLYIISILYLLASLFDINWLFFGLEKFKTTVTKNLVIKVVSVILIFLLVKTIDDFWIYALILSSTTLFSNLYLWLVRRKYVSLTKVGFYDMLKHIRPLLVLFIPVIAVSLYRQMDKIMLGLLSNSTELGYYEQSEKIINIGTSILTAIGTVILPRCSAMYSNGDNKKAMELIKNMNVFSAFISCALSFGFITISNSLAAVYLGDSFYYSKNIVFLLSITIIFISFGNLIRYGFLIPLNKDFPYVLSAIIGALVNVIFNAIFIRKYGAIGVSFGTIIAELVVLIVQISFSLKEINVFKMLLDYIPFILIGIIMVAVNYFIFEFNDYMLSWKSLLLEIITGASSYLILSLLYFIIFKRRMILTILKEKSLY